MIFLQEVPAETTGFMVAGFAVIFGVMLVYILSIYLRKRNLLRDIQVLEDMESGDQSTG